MQLKPQEVGARYWDKGQSKWLEGESQIECGLGGLK